MFCQPYQMKLKNHLLSPRTPLEVSTKKLHPVKLRVMVKMCAENIATDFCFPVSTKTKFSTDNDEALWYKLKALIDSFDAVAEKLYAYFYALFLNNLLSQKFDDKTLRDTLMSELANEILVHLSGFKHLQLEPKDCSLPEKELKK